MLPRIVGLQRAKELIFSARVLGAEEAKAMGIVYDLVPEGEAIEAATELAHKMRLASVAAVGLTKQLLNQTSESSQAAMAQAEALAQAIAIGTEYHADAVQRFVGKSAVVQRFQRAELAQAEGVAIANCPEVPTCSKLDQPCLTAPSSHFPLSAHPCSSSPALNW